MTPTPITTPEQAIEAAARVCDANEQFWIKTALDRRNYGMDDDYAKEADQEAWCMASGAGVS